MGRHIVPALFIIHLSKPPLKKNIHRCFHLSSIPRLPAFFSGGSNILDFIGRLLPLNTAISMGLMAEATKMTTTRAICCFCSLMFLWNQWQKQPIEVLQEISGTIISNLRKYKNNVIIESVCPSIRSQNACRMHVSGHLWQEQMLIAYVPTLLIRTRQVCAR